MSDLDSNLLEGVKVPLCGRCQRSHNGLTFHKITNPIIASVYETYTHWAMCPTLKEPILMAKRDVAHLKINATE